MKDARLPNHLRQRSRMGQHHDQYHQQSRREIELHETNSRFEKVTPLRMALSKPELLWEVAGDDR